MKKDCNSFNRRKFLEVLGLASLASFPFILPGCGKRQASSPKKLSIKGIEYDITNRVMTQSTKGKNTIRLGILNDLHANSKNAQYFAEQLNKERVDAYLLGGDLSWSFGEYNGATNDFEEIKSVVEPVASYGKPVFVMPGNHEQKETYIRALEELSSQYKNVIDLEQVPIVDLDGVTIVSLGGNDNPQFNVPKGFLRTPDDFERLREPLLKYQSSKPVLLATHIPKRYFTKRGLDVVDRGYNVGGVDLTRIRKFSDSRFAVSGHIHESPGIITPNEEPVDQGELVDRLDFNPGAVWDHLQRPNLRPAAGILEFIGNKARAYILNR